MAARKKIHRAHIKAVHKILSDVNHSIGHDHQDLGLQIPIMPGAKMSGIPELASRRGEQIGIYEVYKYIKKKHPKVAASILKHFGMDTKGNYTLKE